MGSSNRTEWDRQTTTHLGSSFRRFNVATQFKMGRVKCWAAAAGKDTATEIELHVLAPCFDELLVDGGFDCESQDI